MTRREYSNQEPPCRKSLRIKSLFPAFYLSRRNSDYAYRDDLRHLALSAGFEWADSYDPLVVGPLNAWALASAVAVRVPGLAWLPSTRPWGVGQQLVWCTSDSYRESDVIITNGALPIGPVPKPLILEHDFCEFGADEGRRSRIRRVLYRPKWAISQASLVIVRHEMSRSAFIKMYPRDAHKVRVVPHYQPHLEPIEARALELKWRNPRPRVIFVGHLARLKGLEVLLKAAYRLRERGFVFDLTVVSSFRDGPVPTPQWVRVLSGLSRSAVVEELRSHHFLALPTFQDAFPRVFLEAFASGCVLMAPSWDPLGTLFGSAGLVVDPLDEIDVTAGLRRLVRDPMEWKNIAVQNREHFLQTYAPDVVREQYIGAWEEAVHSHSSEA